MAPPYGNQNAAKHGLRRMNLNELPRGCGRIRSERAKLRTALESLVLEVRGRFGVYEAAVIQTACRWETHAQLAARWLRKMAGELTPEQRLTFSREVARASSERDRCLKLLGLDRLDELDPFDNLYGVPVASVEAGNGDGGPEAVDGKAAPEGESGDAGGQEHESATVPGV